jgi:hypothetical protein
MEQTIPSTCRVKFENPDALHEFSVIIQPDEGFWKSGKFLFHVVINEDYNISVIIKWAFIKRTIISVCICYFSASYSKMPDKTLASKH